MSRTIYVLHKSVTSSLSVNLSGQVFISGSVIANTNKSISTYRWQRANVFDGGVQPSLPFSDGWTDIGSSTQTYTPTGDDIGYDLHVIATDTNGNVVTSSAVRYDPVSEASVVEIFKLNTLAMSNGNPITILTGSKTGTFLLQPSTAIAPTKANFGGSAYGAAFARASSQYMSGNLNLSSSNKISIVLGIKTPLTISYSIPYCHGQIGVPTTSGSFQNILNFSSVSPPTTYTMANIASTVGGDANIITRTADETFELQDSVYSAMMCMNSASIVLAARTNQKDLTLSTTSMEVGTRFTNDLFWLGRGDKAGNYFDGTIGGAVMFITGADWSKEVWTAEYYIKNMTLINF